MSICKHVRPAMPAKYADFPWCVDEYDKDGVYVCTRYYKEEEQAQEDAGVKEKSKKLF